MAEERGIASSLCIQSFGTSDCEEGNPVYPPVAALLKGKGYSFTHRARKIGLADIKNADYILAMDKSNLSDLLKLTGGNYDGKIFLLGEFLPAKMEVDDPWYTRDFERAYNEIYIACSAFMDYLISGHTEAFAYDGRH